MAEKNITVDLNNFYDQVRKDIASLMDATKVNGAVIFNATKETVTFHVFNYIDMVHWVEAMKTPVAPGYYGTVAASGDKFKIHPNKNRDAEFLVSPGKAYVYEGVGALREVNH